MDANGTLFTGLFLVTKVFIDFCELIVRQTNSILLYDSNMKRVSLV